MLKKVFPFSYRADTAVNLAITVICYLVVGALVSFLFGWIGSIPLVGWVIGVVISLIDLYLFIGLVVSVLVFLKVVK